MTEAAFFNAIQNHFDQHLPFVIFKKPNDDKLKAILQPNEVLNTSESFGKKGFVFSPFHVGDTNKIIWFYEEACKVIETKFTQKDVDFINVESTSLKVKDEHVNRVEKAVEQIKLDQLKKVIISRVEEQNLEHIDPVNWFKKCANLYPSAFSYCWFHPKVGMWLGASPEKLIAIEKNTFSTMALAGTMPFNENAEMEWGKKEIEEQQLVVDSILKELKSEAINLEKSKTITHKAGSLLHLKTEIKGEITNDSSIKVLLELLHPTSAVCGLPKEKSKQYILKNEGYDRKYYTGFLGEFSSESKTEIFVNLRCMEIENKTAKIYVGGGITAQSNAEKEWEETVNKTITMKKVLS